MNFLQPWKLFIARQAQKALEKAPLKDRDSIKDALLSMVGDPFAGDTVFLKGADNGWRRRVGDWRIFYDLNKKDRVIWVTAIRRRSSNTY